jgi:hypothetical protein
LQTSSFLAKNTCDHRLAEDGGNCPLSIADCRLLMHIGRSCHTAFQSAIGNQQSAIMASFGCVHQAAL